MSLNVLSSIDRRGLMIVLSSPSGTGKSTITRALMKEDSSIFLSISATTRPPRPGEEDGVHYFFMSTEEFEAKIEAGEFLEWAKVFDNYYGTPRGPVMQHLDEGKDVLFDIDWQGTRQLRDNARDDMASIYIMPPSLAELERRLVDRGQDSMDVIKKRMDKAASEISHWPEYDYVLVNDDLDAAIDAVRSIVNSERLKRPRLPGLKGFVENLLA